MPNGNSKLGSWGRFFSTVIRGPIILCVWGGGGKVNFEGGNKVWPKYSKGGKLRIGPGGTRFLIICMYNKVLNGQSKPFSQNLLSEQHQAKRLSVLCTFSIFFQILCL